MKLDALIRMIADVHTSSQDAAGEALNRHLIPRNWLIGAWIVEYEQGGEDRAAYDDPLLHRLADGLVEAGVKGLSLSDLRNCRPLPGPRRPHLCHRGEPRGRAGCGSAHGRASLHRPPSLSVSSPPLRQ